MCAADDYSLARWIVNFGRCGKALLTASPTLERQRPCAEVGAGIYTIWETPRVDPRQDCWTPAPVAVELATRPRSHASGRRSGGQFCVYVADHYMLHELTRGQIGDIGDGALSVDSLVRYCVHEHFAYRFATAATYAKAMTVEHAIKRGTLGQRPRLNPPRAIRLPPRGRPPGWLSLAGKAKRGATPTWADAWSSPGLKDT
jgi:hypothetical protein